MTFGNLPYIAIAKPVGYLETKLLNAAQLVLRTQAYVTQLSPFSARKENTISLTFVLQGNSLTQWWLHQIKSSEMPHFSFISNII